jgi:sialate O-acetylesterase
MGAMAYGTPTSASGPRVTQAARDASGGATVTFDGVTGGLHTRSAAQAIAFELCGAEAGSCRYVAATVAGNRVTLAGDGKPATRVRYAWADFPVVNLVDDAGLPAGPFEMPLR